MHNDNNIDSNIVCTSYNKANFFVVADYKYTELWGTVVLDKLDL